MKRVFYNTGEIKEARSCVIKRTILNDTKHDPCLKYRFSGPFTELEECLYYLRTGYPLWWCAEIYDDTIVGQAYNIVAREVSAR